MRCSVIEIDTHTHTNTHTYIDIDKGIGWPALCLRPSPTLYTVPAHYATSVSATFARSTWTKCKCMPWQACTLHHCIKHSCTLTHSQQPATCRPPQYPPHLDL